MVENRGRFAGDGLAAFLPCREPGGEAEGVINANLGGGGGGNLLLEATFRLLFTAF